MYGLGLVATVIGMLGGFPYIYNTYRRKTKPHRIAWAIFLLLSVLTFASQYALGARASLIFYAWFVINNLILLSLSLRKNGGYGDLNLVNVLCLSLALIGIILWKTAHSPLLALISVLIADGIGALLIVIKSYRHPETETMVMWAAGIAGTFLNILAVGKLQASILAAPIQVFLFNIAIVVAILLGRQKKGRPRKKAQTS